MRVKPERSGEVENDILMTDGVAFRLRPQAGHEHGHVVYLEILT